MIAEVAERSPEPGRRKAGGWGWRGVEWATAGIAILAALVHVDTARVADPDLFVTLYSGREIVAHGGPPGVDTVSFSVNGQPWRDYEWLARALFYATERAAGGAGLVVARLGITGALLAILAAMAARRSASVLPFLLVLGLFSVTAGRFFLFRPTLFTFLLLAVLLLLIGLAREGRRRLLWAVVPLMVLWTNLHAGFALGVVVLVMLVGESLLSTLLPQRHGVLGWATLPLGLTAGVLCGATAASLVHPLGYRVWAAVLGTIRGTFTPQLTEWMPMHAYGFLHYLPVYALMVLVVVILLLAAREAAPFDAMLAVTLLIASLAHVRYIPLFVIASSVVLLTLLPEAGRRLAGAIPKVGNAISSRATRTILLVASAVSLTGVCLFEGVGDLKIRKVEDLTPVPAVHLLSSLGVGGNVFTEYDWGGYVEWEIPGAKIFVDGRSDTVYPHELIGEWWSVANAVPGWDGTLDRYGVRVVLLRRSQAAVRKLETASGWVPVYVDTFSALFLRDSQENAGPIAALRAGRVPPPPSVSDYEIR